MIVIRPSGNIGPWFSAVLTYSCSRLTTMMKGAVGKGWSPDMPLARFLTF